MTLPSNRTNTYAVTAVTALILLTSSVSIPAQVPHQPQNLNSRSLHQGSDQQQSRVDSRVTTQNRTGTPAETVARSFHAKDPVFTANHAPAKDGSTTSSSERAVRNDPKAIRLFPRREQPERTETTSSEFTEPIITVASSLAIVIGLFFFVTWIFRRSAPRQSVRLPGEAFEFLGRAPLAGRQEMQLLRLGHKLLLLAVTPTSAQTLTEITDPDEVDRISGICLNHSPNLVTKTFQSIASPQRTHTSRPTYDTPSLGSDLRG